MIRLLSEQVGDISQILRFSGEKVVCAAILT